jgi:DNA-binding HxlR family transcriptional regulator
MRVYGQFCPVARTAELFAERWTPIIVRNLLNDCTTFTEIRQGAPGIPTALLAQRLDALERNGIVERDTAPSGRGTAYRLTGKGRELKTVCDAMGQWGAKWLEIEPRHMDPAYVLWATARLVDVEQLPPQTVVVRFDLTDRPDDRYWLVLRRPQPELCTRGTGYVEDVVVRTDAACLIDIHLRRTTYRQAMRDDRLALDGAPRLARAFLASLKPSPYADVAPAITEP